MVACGSAGMSMLYQLGKLPYDEIPDIVCYEMQETVGGVWNVCAVEWLCFSWITLDTLLRRQVIKR